MDNSINEKESLEIIRTMIHKAQTNMSEGSIFYLIWGWAVLLAIIAQYALLEWSGTEYHWVAWPVLMSLAGIVSAIVGRKRASRQKYVTFVDNTMAFLWGGFVIFLFAILFLSPTIGWANSYLLVIGLYGLGTFVSGGVLRFRPLIIGGVISLGLCFTGILLRNSITEFTQVLILLAISIVCSYLVPGYMLRAQKNKHAS